MQIIARCPRCANNWKLDSSAADRRLRCPKCQKLFKVPKLSELPRATEVIQKTKGAIYVDQEGKTYG
jgi:tRNA(Ile2) C34 agmatinyltransferase TiaS